MVDTEGPIEVASQQNYGQRGEDRTIDQIVLELRRYNVSVGALGGWLSTSVMQTIIQRRGNQQLHHK